METQNSGFALPGFSRLARSTYLQDSQLSLGTYQAHPERPSAVSPFSSPLNQAAGLSDRHYQTAPPDLIIITSWTGAAPKYVAKYTESYNSLYPGVPILVITTIASDLVIRSARQNIKALGPAAEFLLSREPAPAIASPAYSNQRHPQPEPPSKLRFSSILLHAFSEGGAHKAVCLAHAYLRSTNHASPLPIAALILDSTPGTPRPKNLARGLRQALPHSKSSPLTRALHTALSAGVVWLTWGALQFRRRKSGNKEQDFISQTRKALNDERLWGDLRGVPRTYLFGEDDEIIQWDDIHSHGVESAMIQDEGGVGSLMVRFKTVQALHASLDGERKCREAAEKELRQKTAEAKEFHRRWKLAVRELNELRFQRFYTVTDDYLIERTTDLRYKIRNLAIQYFEGPPRQEMRLAKGLEKAGLFQTFMSNVEDVDHYLYSEHGCPIIIEALLWRFLTDNVFGLFLWAGTVAKPLAKLSTFLRPPPAVSLMAQFSSPLEIPPSQPNASCAADARKNANGVVGMMRQSSVDIYPPSLLAAAFQTINSSISFMRQPGNFYQAGPISALNLCIVIREEAKKFFPVDKPDLFELQPSEIISELDGIAHITALRVPRPDT
ncbi:hypothetical protein VTK56DRAFT_5502 [Thermocarpiscus australiensis]